MTLNIDVDTLFEDTFYSLSLILSDPKIKANNGNTQFLAPELVKEFLVVIRADNQVQLQEFLSPFNETEMKIHSFPPGTDPALLNDPYLIDVAAFYGAEECLRYLISLNHRKDWDDKGRLLAHFSAYSGKVSIFNLLEENNFKIESVDLEGNMPIHIASKKNHRELCEYLWTKGSNMTPFNESGYAPIHLSVQSQSFDVFEFFISIGIDPNMQTQFGKTMFCTAIMSGYQVIIKYFIDHRIRQDPDRNGIYPIHAAIKSGDTETFETLISLGGDVDCQDNEGHTPLIFACMKGSEHLVLLLIEEGADFNLPDNSGRTPLHYAAKRGHYEIVSILLDCGADFHVYDNKDLTPMNLAFMKRHSAIVQLFEDFGMDNLNLEPDPTMFKRSKQSKWSKKIHQVYDDYF